MISNLDYYKAFFYVATYSSFSDAARALYISQSAVSQTIRKLEEELSTTLFVRNGQRIVLTPSGELLFARVKTAFNEFQKAEIEIQNFESIAQNNISVGITETSLRYGFFDCLEKFKNRHPDVHLSISGNTTPEMVSFLRDGKIDFALMIISDSLAARFQDLRMRRCFRIQDIFIASSKMDIDFDREYDLKDLLSYPTISVSQISNFRENIDTFFQENGLLFQPTYILENMTQVLNFTKRKFGIGVLPYAYAKDDIKKGTIRIVNTKPIPKRTVYLVSLKDKALSGLGLELYNEFKDLSRMV
ncbi:LysR family transcriptional regulator [Butyrivibrio fibrisolvens]|uniref:LysR family transcriptional regulator n=1 Tax=Butyrivibrio fibrisolvens TaxID=831 RepID=UPI0004158D11|nr:LysR family transcriptional regulator [Butyrivibrio fibrisolvens]